MKLSPQLIGDVTMQNITMYYHSFNSKTHILVDCTIDLPITRDRLKKRWVLDSDWKIANASDMLREILNKLHRITLICRLRLAVDKLIGNDEREHIQLWKAASGSRRRVRSSKERRMSGSRRA